MNENENRTGTFGKDAIRLTAGSSCCSIAFSLGKRHRGDGFGGER